MNRLTLFLIFGCFTSFSQSPLEITQITPQIYKFTTFKSYQGNKISAHGVIALSKNSAIIIDTPWDENHYQRLLDTVQTMFNRKVTAFIGTHSHADRAGGFGFYNQLQIPTYCTTKTNEILKELDEPIGSHSFKNDTTFVFDGLKIETYFAGEGHTKDNIVVYFPKSRVLFGGCLVKSEFAKDIGYTGEANLDEWPKSIERLRKKYPRAKFLIPGHEDGLSLKALDRTLELIKE